MTKKDKFPDKGFCMRIWFKSGLDKKHAEIVVDGSVSMDNEELDSEEFKNKMGEYVVRMLKQGIFSYEQEKQKLEEKKAKAKSKKIEATH
jgi:hypothetical protein